MMFNRGLTGQQTEMASDSDNNTDNTPSIDGAFRLSVTRDKYIVTLENLLPPVGGGKAVTPKQVNDKLQKLARKEKAKRLEGINHEAIEAALRATAAGMPPGEPVIIVEGTRPEHGLDAELVWHVDCGAATERRIVYPQQLLVGRKPATTGTPGRDVFGNVMRARPGVDRSLVAGENVTATVSDGVNEYRAAIWGAVELRDNTVKVVAPGLQVADDHMQAYLDIYADASGSQAGQDLCEQIIETLGRHKIIHGVQQDRITDALQQAASQPGHVMARVLAASGSAPVHGRDAVVEYYFEQQATQQHERLVLPGQLIARLIHATPGTPGTDIFNAAIPARPGTERVVAAGDNVDVRQVDNASEYYATSMGFAGIDDNTVSVTDLPVHVSDDGMVVHMDVYAGSRGKYRQALTTAHVIQHAGKMRISYGLDEAAIGALIEQLRAAENDCILQAAIAHGMEPVNGRPAHVRWYIDMDSKAQDATTVVHNQIMAAHAPATMGECGRDVYGREIPASPGKELQLVAGVGVGTHHAEGVEVLVAEYLGYAAYADGKLSVHKYEVDISADAMTATMNLPARTGGKYAKTVQVEDVVGLLGRYGICDGIDREAIKDGLVQAANAAHGMHAQVIVARGTPAIHGQDGSIVWEFDIQSGHDRDRVVVAGQLIATVVHHTVGTPGKGIDGRVLEARAGKEVVLDSGQWVAKSTTENGDEYRAGCLGILELDNTTVSIRSPNLHILADGLEASMDIHAFSGGNRPQQVATQQIVDMLQHAGICFGVNASIIEETLALARMKKDIGEPCVAPDTIVAVGRNKRDGQPAQIRIAHRFAPSVILSHGRLDLHELGYPWDVRKNMSLGVFQQALMGEDGMTVTGETIAAQKVKEVTLTLANINIDEEGELIAACDGVFLINGFDLMVTDQVIIDKDVDLHTGNIHTESSVHIKGYVTNGFIVEADGDVIIDQNIENATVRSRGNVIVHGGIRGMHSRVEAGGNIAAHFVEYGHLLAGNNIEITQSSVDAHLTAANSIFLGPDPGALITSKCAATGQLYARSIGHPASDPSEIRLGMSAEQHDRLLKLRALDAANALQQAERERLESLSHSAEQSALRVQGAIHSDVILHIGHDVHVIKGDTVSCKDYYLDPKTLKITSRLHEPDAPVPVIQHGMASATAVEDGQSD